MCIVWGWEGRSPTCAFKKTLKPLKNFYALEMWAGFHTLFIKQLVAQAVCSQNPLLPLFYMLSSIISREREAPAVTIPHGSHSHISKAHCCCNLRARMAVSSPQTTVSVVSSTEPSGMLFVTGMLLESTALKSWTSLEQINMCLFITAGREEVGCDLGFHPQRMFVVALQSWQSV